jgi:hypothetical protein
MAGSTLTKAAGISPASHRSDVLDRLTADASTLRGMGLSRCAVFGSFARDQAIHPDSDVDLVTMEGLSRHLAPSVLTEAAPICLGDADPVFDHDLPESTMPC